jgi:hypothetical protein
MSTLVATVLAQIAQAARPKNNGFRMLVGTTKEPGGVEAASGALPSSDVKQQVDDKIGSAVEEQQIPSAELVPTKTP